MDIQLWKKRRKELGISYDELANASGIARRTIINIFQGQTPTPRVDTVEAIERALGLNSNSKSTWTSEDYVGGVTDRGTVQVNAAQYELLELFDIIGQQGEERQQEFLKIARVYANTDK